MRRDGETGARVVGSLKVSDSTESREQILEKVAGWANKKGRLSPGDVSEMLDGADFSAEDLEWLYSSLQRMGVEVSTEDENDEDYSREEEFLGNLEVSVGQGTTDPVRLYLKEIGRISLLTGDEEVEVARRILERAVEAKRRLTVSKLLDGLSYRERKIIELRFGLHGEVPRTLEDVGARFGVTRERIRQVEANTLQRLRYFREKH